MKWTSSLKQWRAKRGIVEAQSNYAVMIAEESQELFEAIEAENELEMVDAFCDLTVLTQNQITLEALPSYQSTGIPPDVGYNFGSDNQKFLADFLRSNQEAIEELGYVFNLCMKETLKEISSRQQEPLQCIDWATNGPSGKWQKWQQQPVSTLYSANYELCKAGK